MPANLMNKIMGFVVIIITIALGPTIYTANADIVTHLNVSQMIGMSVVAGFGAFIIIFGLLVSGGMMVIMGTQTAGKGDMLKVVGSVVVIVVALTMMDSIMTYIITLLQAAQTAGDTLGETGFAIIPILIYGGILGLAGWTHVTAIRKMKKSKKLARAYL